MVTICATWRLCVCGCSQVDDVAAISNGGIVNPLVTNGLSHPYHLDESSFIFRGFRNNFFIFNIFFDEIHVSKQNSPR